MKTRPAPADQGRAETSPGEQLLRHFGRRLLHQPLKALLLVLYLGLVVWGGLDVLTHLRVFDIGPSVERLWHSALLLGVLGALVVALDRLEVRPLNAPWPWNVAPPDPRLQPPGPADRVYGWAYERLWDEATGAPLLRPQRARWVYHGVELARRSKLVVGPSGAGKSFMGLRRDLLWARRNGHHATLIDPKGLHAADYPRELFTHLFVLDDLAASFRWNIYSDLGPQEAAEVLAVCLFPVANRPREDADYYADNARVALQAIFRAHVVANSFTTPWGAFPGCYPSVKELFQYVADPDAVQRLAARLPDGSMEQLDLAHVMKLARDKRGTLDSLFNALAPLAHAPVADLLVGPGEGCSLAELSRRPDTRLGFGLDLARYPEIGRILGRLALALWAHAVLGAPHPPGHFRLMICDELADFLASADMLLRAMEKGRSANAGFSFALQSFAQLPDDRVAARFWNAAGIRMLFGGGDYYTAHLATQHSGAAERIYRDANLSHSAGRSQGHYPGGPTAQRQETQVAGYHAGRRLRADWLEAEIQAIPPQHCLLNLDRLVVDPAHPADPLAGEREVVLVALDLAPIAALEAWQDRENAFLQLLLPPSGPAAKEETLATLPEELAPPDPTLRGSAAQVVAIHARLRTQLAAWQALGTDPPANTADRRRWLLLVEEIRYWGALDAYCRRPTPERRYAVVARRAAWAGLLAPGTAEADMAPPPDPPPPDAALAPQDAPGATPPDGAAAPPSRAPLPLGDF